MAKKSKTNMKQLDTLWSKIIRKNFDNKCAVCGATPCQAHHIFTRSYKSTRWDIDNGIALCYKHHFYLAHSKFEEFRDFVVNLLGEEKYGELKAKSQILWKGNLEYEFEKLKKLLS